MLTFILLVVLAGGVGLVAVSVAERPDPATQGRRIGRALRPKRGLDPVADSVPRERTGSRDAPVRAPEPPSRSRRASVPASLTAVEGAFGVVAVASPVRRLFSLVLLVAICLAVALAIAAGVGLVAVAVGHALDSAIG